jgi:hypothetical protein
MDGAVFLMPGGCLANVNGTVKSTHPEALPMRDAENLAALGAEIDKPDAEHSLDLSCVDPGKFALTMGANR